MQKFDGKNLAQNTQMYQEYYAMQLVDGWEDSDKQFNFSHLLRIEDFAKKSLLNVSVIDVGCGTGDLSPVLRKHGVKRYLGIDIYEPAHDLARKKHPREKFLFADVIAGDIIENFDFAFCSGALSIALKDSDNYKFLESMIESMWEMTRYGVVFNLMTDEDTDPDPDLFYYSKEKVKEICQNVAPEAKTMIVDTPLTRNSRITDHQAHIYLYR